MREFQNTGSLMGAWGHLPRTGRRKGQAGRLVACFRRVRAGELLGIVKQLQTMSWRAVRTASLDLVLKQ